MSDHPLRDNLADPAARDRLLAAVAAAGLGSADELYDLLSASGILTEHAALALERDPAAPPLTLAEVGADLDVEMAAVEADPQARRALFASLAPVQQDALLGHRAAVRGETPYALAALLGVAPSRVRRVLDDVLHRRGDLVVQSSREQVLGRLVAAAELAAERLAAEGRWKDYWQVNKDLATKLEDLGVVRRQVQVVQHDVNLTVTDARQREVDALLEVERKQRIRLLELQRASATDAVDVQQGNP